MSRWPLKDHNRLILKHLRSGDAIQKEAARCIDRIRVLQVLKPYAPLIVGTLPIDVHLPGSDVDIVCHVEAPRKFTALLKQAFGGLPSFAVRRETLQGHSAVVCAFGYRRTAFEIVGMPVETASQQAYVHLMVEADLLQIAGRSRACAAIRRLKRGGLKTEPAFAEHFKLAGEPYRAVARLWRGIDKPLDLQRVTLVTTARLALPAPSLKS